MNHKDKLEYDFSKMSEGVEVLTDGYIDYSREVITNRALPDIRDGLKPVQRKILWTLESDKVKGKMKSARLAGNVLAYHPHGNAAVYQAMVLMVDNNGSMSMPLLSGQGNFGGFYKTDPPGADRYTEAGLSPKSREYFGELDGVEMVDNFDATLKEPEVLPVNFPSVLVNASTGIAVGFKSSIPSFNFHDVVNLTKEYLREGKCSTVICPDFVNGGYYVRNNKELQKLMETGVAKLTLRGKAEIEGREITIVEFPNGVTIQSLKKQIDSKNYVDVRTTGDFDDFKSGAGLWVDTISKTKVESVLHKLYKGTDLQKVYNADMTMIKAGEPMQLGVWGVIETWCEWRADVLEKALASRLVNLQKQIEESNAFVHVVEQTEKRDKLLHILTYEGKEEGVDYILENYDPKIITSRDLATWVVGRGAVHFKDGGKYKKLHKQLSKEIKENKKKSKDIKATILEELECLSERYTEEFARKTEVTNQDYDFKSVEVVEKDKTVCYYTLRKGFLRKTKTQPEGVEYDYQIKATASSTLVLTDSKGRLMRVFAEQLGYDTATSLGTYLLRYFGLKEERGTEYTSMTEADGKEKLIVYRDGNLGFINTGEWEGVKRQVKVNESGINKSSKVGVILNDLPEVLSVKDSRDKMSYVNIKEVLRKNRTAKTRVFNIPKTAEVLEYLVMTEEEASFIYQSGNQYEGQSMQKVDKELKLTFTTFEK